MSAKSDMTGLFGLESMERLTDAERTLVEGAMLLLPRTLGERRLHGFVPILGRERVYDAATVAYMRAAKCWKPGLAPFEIYSRIWLRKYLIQSLADMASTVAFEIPETWRCPSLDPSQQAENMELIAAAMRVLPLRQREVLMLRSVGLTWPEVAVEMGCCMNLVRRYYVRAMTRIWRFVPQIRGG